MKVGWALPETRPSAALLETDTETVIVSPLAVLPWFVELLLPFELLLLAEPLPLEFEPLLLLPLLEELLFP